MYTSQGITRHLPRQAHRIAILLATTLLSAYLLVGIAPAFAQTPRPFRLTIGGGFQSLSYTEYGGSFFGGFLGEASLSGGREAPVLLGLA